jgi:hypothetical protein
MMPVAICVQLAVGLGFAWLARDRVRADGPFAVPAFQLVMLHAAGVVAPIALYFYTAHPAWSWMYLFDPSGVSGLAVLPLVVAHGGLVVGAYYGGGLLLRADKRKPFLYTLGGLGAAALVLILIGRSRLGVSASHAGYHAGHGRGIMEVELGWAVLIALLATGGSIAYVAFELSRDALRVRSR